MDDLNNFLTSDDWVWLDTKQVSLDVSRPIPQREQNDSLLVHAKLSRQTQAREAKRLALLQQKKASLRNRKKRDRRKRPWTAKQYTVRQRRIRQWATKPLSCVITGYGSYRITKHDWDRLIGPLWSLYSPSDLTVKRYKRDSNGNYYGTKANPYTIYSLDIIHSTHGVVYSGSGQELYDLSC